MKKQVFEFNCRKKLNLELNSAKSHGLKIYNQRVFHTNEISTESQHSYNDEDIEIAEEVSETNFSYATGF